MPEGDTVARQCRILDEALAGAVLTACDLRVPREATADLVGWTVSEVRPRGKHLLLRLTPPAPGPPPLTLHSHLMMDGIWHVDGKALRSSDTSAGPRSPDTLRILLEATHADGRQVRAAAYDVKQVRVLRTADEEQLLGSLGPDLLDPAWEEDPSLRERAITNLTAEPARPLGLALLDQHVLAGIGNIYRSELCFLRRLHPAAPTSAEKDPGVLVDLARRLLVLNRDRAVRVTTGGMLGRDGDLWVYGRGGKQCRRCRTRIERGELAEPRLEGTEARVLWFCPWCQAGPGAPPATGRRRHR
ncbi:DNA-formamidopyrimidine glycosylase family protein [Brachybacterium saurashtrense]|uniref:DNA-(apurinic or apyrimidinic site) lyase n=1 Tax=Brachybacterium saurashtrense TaxID=556288 RepID=A0A345YNC6_9MICO|nr:DNA-formamidopyrimidine glycosylase family protein [Brachybacterium saurashtrense]AXK45428.1 formamidopyrimidine-DNA glycosylase [Brachybacterium saurashtrense]RRR21199.1 formamidopyrimidine-DNA glycosylase [Brachybacterium saurashtrense]